LPWRAFEGNNKNLSFKLELLDTFERLLNQEKTLINFLESSLPQALWVAGK